MFIHQSSNNWTSLHFRSASNTWWIQRFESGNTPILTCLSAYRRPSTFLILSRWSSSVIRIFRTRLPLTIGWSRTDRRWWTPELIKRSHSHVLSEPPTLPSPAICLSEVCGRTSSFWAQEIPLFLKFRCTISRSKVSVGTPAGEPYEYQHFS